MSTNDPILLKQILDQKRAEIAPDLSEPDFFNLFCAGELLKDFSLSYDEIESGLVDGSQDGGIDGVWLFANGELVREDTDVATLKKNVDLHLVILQSKRSPGFKEDPINRMMSTTENLLQLSNDTADFADRYSSELRAAIDLFRATYQKLAGRFPKLRITYYYATLATETHPNCTAKANDLRAKIPALFSDAEVDFNFIGAPELLEIGRRQPASAFQLNIAESLSASGAVSYVCLVLLKEWFNFITDESNNIREELFEANVRDFQGDTEVNKEILSSLEGNGDEDFWWLNNGVTVLAGKATQSGKVLTIEDPQIVNGLQTSRRIYEWYSKSHDESDKRHVLVRLIVADADESRDRIIKATNSQTYITPASLKATDKIQRDIEDFLKPHGIYYDRRKNYYKNQGKPISDIVPISKLAQAMMAIVLGRPNEARARPSSLIKSETDYPKLFNETHPLASYLASLRILRKVEKALRQRSDIEQRDQNNIKFYAALEVARQLTGEQVPSLSSLQKIADQEIPLSVVETAIDRVKTEYEALGGTDKVAKGPELKTRLATKASGTK